jgi:hypothetical protein
MFQVTDIQFDFDDYDEAFEGDPIPQQEVIDKVLTQVWQANDGDDLVDKITIYAGFPIKSIDYRYFVQ